MAHKNTLFELGATDLKSVVRKDVRVRSPLRVPFLPLAKNEACQGFASCRCQAELHTLQYCCNVLHTATAVLHFLQALSDEALFR